MVVFICKFLPKKWGGGGHEPTRPPLLLWPCHNTLVNFDLKLGQSCFGRWRVGSMYTNNSTLAACNESDEEEIVTGTKGALTRQKWNFQCQISNVHKLTDLSETFQKLEKLPEAVVKAKYGPLQRQVRYEASHV